jgi:hypothetical protein
MNLPASHMLKHAAVVLTLAFAIAMPAAPPSHVEITWMSIANIHYQIGSLGVITDGYITRIPQSDFHGGGGGLAYTRKAHSPDVAAVTRVMDALGGPASIHLLLTGHSHFDHSFDTATWSRLTGANIIGPRTTCLQAEAERIPASKCRAVEGREAITLAEGVTMRVVRFNHSGDSAVNPEQHNPMELAKPPSPDPETGGLRAGVAEDFPNGGGGRGFLFTVDSPDGRLSWFYQNSASAVDLKSPIVFDGVDHGAPFENLKAALQDANLESVDLWIGTGGAAIARLVVPVIKPKAYLPIHWDGLYAPFFAGMPRRFSDAGLEQFLESAGVNLMRPGQYMDKWRLDQNGIRPVENTAVKKALGLSEVQSFQR